MKTQFKQKSNGKYILEARQYSEKNLGKNGLSFLAVVGVSCETQEFWLLNLIKNTSSGIMLYCSLTDHAVSRQEQYLVQRLLTFYTEPCYIPVMGN